MPASLALVRNSTPAARAPDLRVVGSRPVVVLDGSPDWQSGTGGVRVETVAPGTAAAATIAGLDPSRLVVNLASTGALATLAALRVAGSRVPALGCLAAAGASRVLALGMVEPLARPMDQADVAAALAGHARRGTKVVTVGHDIDALVALRYTLTQKGMSVAMAWDARQTADLLPLVRPDVIVLDLGLPGGDGHAVLAALATEEPCPVVALLAGDADPARALAAELARPANACRGVVRDRFLASVAGRA